MNRPFSRKTILCSGFAVTAAFVLLLFGFLACAPYSLEFFALATLGALVMPVAALSFGRIAGPGISNLFMLCFFALGLIWFYPHCSLFLVLFVVFFAVPIVQNMLLDRTDSLYVMFMYGLPPVFALIIAASVLAIRSHYGVFDFEGFYGSVLAYMENALTLLGRAYAQNTLLPQQMQEFMAQMITILKSQLDILVASLLMQVLVIVMGQYFWTLQVTKLLFEKSPLPVPMQPLYSFVMLRPLAYLYMAFYVFRLFVSGASFALGLEVALTLFGWGFVLVGIGTVNRFILLRKGARWLRCLIDVILLGMAFFSMGGGLLSAYNILLFIGLMISTANRTLIIRTASKRSHDDEDNSL